MNRDDEINDSQASVPPGPRWPGAVQAFLLYRDPIGFLERREARYGPVFRVKFPGAPALVYITDPSLAQQLYAGDRGANRAGETRAPYLSPLVGERSLLCLDGDVWEQQHRLIAPALRGERIEGWRERIAEIARTEVEQWPAGETIELRPRMRRITLDVILQLVFGIDDAQRLDELRRLLPELLDAVNSPFVFGLPAFRELLGRPPLYRIPGNPVRRFRVLRDRADRLLYDEIARRRTTDTSPGTRDDLLSTLLEARGDDGEPMSDGELRDELMTLLVAGHETTSTALAWTFERLVRHPTVLAKLIDDLDGDGADYLRAVIRETLRARPVVFDTPRVIGEPVELGGYTIPAGWWAAPAIPLIHASAPPYSEPETFDPERFIDANPPVGAWIPFGGGRHHCPGSSLALLELETVIPIVVSSYRLTAVDPAAEGQRVHNVTLAPSNNASVRITRR